MRDGHKMQQASGNHEQMPDAMPVAKALVKGKENDSHGVEHAARRQPDEAGGVFGYRGGYFSG